MSSPEQPFPSMKAVPRDEKGNPRLIILVLAALGIVPILLIALSFILHFWGFVTDPLFEEQLIASIPSVVIIALLTIIFSGFLGWYAYRRFIFPIEEVANTARRFIQGNWNARVRLEQDDEIGTLAQTFNTMADELTRLYLSLETQVEDRTRQLRIANEVANMAASNQRLDDFLSVTVNLLVDRLGYHLASVFLVDEAGESVKLFAATGHYGALLKESGYQVAITSPSLVGWVVKNNQVQVITDAQEDIFVEQEDVYPGARSEAGIPIRLGDQVLGALIVQSRDLRTFDPERLASLQTLANQIAPSIQNTRLLETVQIDLQETSNLYRASRQIAMAKHDDEIYEAAIQALEQTSRTAALMVVEDGQLVVRALIHFPGTDEQPVIDRFPVRLDLIEGFFEDSSIRVIEDIYRAPEYLANVISIPRQKGCQSIALIAVRVESKLTALLMLAGENAQRIQEPILQPFASLAEMIGISLQKVRAVQTLERRLEQQRRMSHFGQIISSETDPERLYMAIYEHLVLEFGKVDMQIIQFEKKDNNLDILFEMVDGQEKQTAGWKPEEDWLQEAIGSGKPFRRVSTSDTDMDGSADARHEKLIISWLGVPLIANNNNFGVLLVKTSHSPEGFKEEDEDHLTILATPIAISIRNTQLLSGLQTAEHDVADRVRQMHTAAEIARDTVNIGMLNLDEHLSRISSLVLERFGLTAAAIYLFDARSESLVLKQSSSLDGRSKSIPEVDGIGAQSVVSLAAARKEPRLSISRATGWFHRPAREQADPEDELALPILGGKELLGILDLYRNHLPGFSQKDIETYQILADLIAVAILNSRLIGNIQEHLSIHRLLHHTASAAASCNTIEDALQSIVNGLAVIYTGSRIAVYLVSSDRTCLDLISWMGFPVDNPKQYTTPVGCSLIGWVAENQQPAMIPDTRMDERHLSMHASTHSILAVPLLYRDSLSGVISLESDQVYAFNEIDQELVSTLGSTLAAIIANSQLLEKVQQQVDRQRKLYEITSQIRRSTDMEMILKASAVELGKVLGTDLTRIEITAPPGKHTLWSESNHSSGELEEE